MNNIKGAIDITEKWTNVSKQGFVKEMKYYKHNGVKYPVDGHYVVLKPSLEEREVANVLASKYGKTVLLVPRFNLPKGVQTPDYIIDGIKYDLKSPNGKTKETLFNRIKSGEQQARNFIVSINNYQVDSKDLIEQLSVIFTNEVTSFVRTIVVYENCKILNVYKKQGDPRNNHDPF